MEFSSGIYNGNDGPLWSIQYAQRERTNEQANGSAYVNKSFHLKVITFPNETILPSFRMLFENLTIE